MRTVVLNGRACAKSNQNLDFQVPACIFAHSLDHPVNRWPKTRGPCRDCSVVILLAYQQLNYRLKVGRGRGLMDLGGRWEAWTRGRVKRKRWDSRTLDVGNQGRDKQNTPDLFDEFVKNNIRCSRERYMPFFQLVRGRKS